MTERPDLPPGVTIGKPPPELELDDEDDDEPYWRRRYDEYGDDYRRTGPTALESATAFPKRAEAEGPPEMLRSSKQFACSGSIDSDRYAEASKYRTMPNMGWLEARVALNRLVADIGSYNSRYRVTARNYVALAEFVLSASGFEGFEGRKGDNAVKLRSELRNAVGRLHRRLHDTLERAARSADVASKPITARLQGEMWHNNSALWAMVPTAFDAWVRIIEAKADQATAALDFLRATLSAWQERRPFTADVAARLNAPDPLPTAQDYAEALHIAEMLDFVGQKATILYSGVMHSIPFYRLYPAISDHKAIALWWPWGRDVLFYGVPPRPAATGRRVLDPAIITTTRAQDVVKEVMKKTGMNRITAQRLTAEMRKKMRQERVNQARRLLWQGATKAEVAKRVGLSPSRISALFKGPTKQFVLP